MLTRESLVEWATHWVPDNPIGQKQRFAEALYKELENWVRVDQVAAGTPPAAAPLNTSAGVFDSESSLGRFR